MTKLSITSALTSRSRARHAPTSARPKLADSSVKVISRSQPAGTTMPVSVIDLKVQKFPPGMGL
jgi:hypothetical protein